MTNEEKDKTYNKWDNIINSVGLTGSKADWMAEYAQLHQDKESKIEENTLTTEDTSIEFPSLLPIAMRVAARTIGQDIGGFYTQEEMDSVKNRVRQENRGGKIESILEDKQFEEKKLEEDEEYKKLLKKGVTPMSGPTGQLFYLDFKYGTQSI
jgi:hypothetical protein